MFFKDLHINIFATFPRRQIDSYYFYMMFMILIITLSKSLVITFFADFDVFYFRRDNSVLPTLPFHFMAA